MEMTIKSSKTFNAPIADVWSAQVDVHALPATFKLRQASDPTMEPVGSNMTIFSALSGTLVSTTEESRAPTCHVTTWSGSKWLYSVAWVMSRSYSSKVELASAGDDRTRVTASTTIHVSALLSAACVLAFVLVLQMLNTLAPADPELSPPNTIDLVVLNVFLFSFSWVLVGFLAPWFIAKSASSNSIQRIKRSLKQDATSSNRA